MLLNHSFPISSKGDLNKITGIPAWGFFLLLAFSGNVAYSQVKIETAPDTTHKKVKSIKPAFDFDQRFSFITNDPVNIWGGRAGILVNEKFKVGAGAYFLNDKLKDNTVDSITGQSKTYAHRNLYFGTVYFEPFLFRKKFWELSIPIEAGFGKSIFKVYETGTDLYLNEVVKYFFPTGAGLSLSLKLPAFFGWRPFRWIGINGLIGYRYDLYEKYYQTHYDGMYWSISGAIFLDRVSDDIHYWKEQKRKKKIY